MENRILINGEWYVRESTITETPIVVTSDDCTFSQSVVYETETSCWEASRIYHSWEADNLYDDFAIEYTNKVKWANDRNDRSAIEYWDNPTWLRGVMEENPDSVKIAQEILSPRDLQYLQAFLRKLNELGWM